MPGSAIRQSEIERRALSLCGFRPDAAAQALDNALAGAKANTAARRLWTMQTFERKEDLFGKLGIKALTVIGDEDNISPMFLLSSNLETRRLGSAEFDSIAN